MMAMVWELPNFAYILYSLYAKICKYQKTAGSPSQKPGFVGQDFVGSYGFFLRFSNRGHSLFLLRLRPFESSIRIFNRASEFELPARLLSWNGSRAGGSTSPSSARAPRSCAWVRQQTMPLLARAVSNSFKIKNCAPQLLTGKVKGVIKGSRNQGIFQVFLAKRYGI